MNDNVPPVFILDANIFIEAHKRYYGLDLCPGFWECLIHHFHSKRLKSIDHVRSELVGYGDELSDWVGNAPGELFVSSLESQVTEAYREVMSWVYRNQQFSDAAKNEFSRGADGWLAAYAKAYGMDGVRWKWGEEVTDVVGARIRVDAGSAAVCRRFWGCRWRPTVAVVSEMAG